MSFTHPNPCLIQSSTGFSVERVDRSTLVYTDTNRSTTISIELLVGDVASFVLYESSITSWNDGTAVSALERSNIITDIRNAYQSIGKQFDVE